jgi:peroxiredoxin
MRRHLLPALAALLLLGDISHAAPQIGKPAPAFAVRDSSGTLQTLGDHLGNVVVLEWSNLDCPEVAHLYEGEMQALQREYMAKGVVWLTVVSAASGKEGYLSPEQGNQRLREHDAEPTALLLDESGSMGRAYEARQTPQMFIVGIDGMLAYMGGLEGKDGDGATVPWFTRALNAVLAREPVSESITAPSGCDIAY